MDHLRMGQDRRAAQTALAASEQQAALILQSVGEGILGIDASGKISFGNPAALAMLGWSSNQLLGRDVHATIHSRGQSHPQCAGDGCPIVQTMCDRLSRRVTDESFLRKDGSGFPVEYRCSPLLDDSGANTGAVVSFRDITEERLARDGLLQRLSLLRAAGRAARLGGWTIELPGRELTWSDENCAIHDVPPGYRPTLEEGIGYFLPEHQAQVKRHVEACARDGTPYEFELPKLTAKGRRIWVRSVGEAVRDAEGRIIRLQGAFQDITDQKKSDEALRQKDALLRIAGRVAQIGGWAIELPAQRVFWSDEVFDILEFPDRELPPLAQFLVLYPESDRSRIVQAVETCARDGTPFDVEAEIRTAKDRLIWVRVCGEAHRDAEGAIRGVQGAFQDISLRRQETMALRRSEGRFRLLFDNSLDGMLLARPDGTILAANRSACAIFDMSEEKLKLAGRAGVTDLTDPRVAELFAARERDGVTRGELRMLRAGNQPFEAEISSAVFEAGVEGGVADRLSGIFVRDVTVRRQAERKLQAQLMRTALLHQITQAIGDRLDLESVFQVVSDSVKAHLPADFVALARLDAEAQQIMMSRVAAADGVLNSPFALSETLALPARHDELERWIAGEIIYQSDLAGMEGPLARELIINGLRSAVLAPLHTESGVFGLLIVARTGLDAFSADEYTFIRQLSEHVALAASQARLHGALRQAFIDLDISHRTILQQERLRALGQMASGVAHDINNAISPVALYTEALLEDEPGLSARARGYLETIQRSVDDVAKTVGRMREFYRPSDTGAQSAEVAINPLVAQVIDSTRARWRDIPQKAGVAISIATQLDQKLPTILAVEGEVRDALTNLIFNAVDAMPKGGAIVIRTGVAVTQEGARQVLLEVADNGVGMDEQARRRCLEPFFTTKGQRGTGLGLAMVYGMAQRHGGDVEIESAPGVGTTVRLMFPVGVSTTSSASGAVPTESRPACSLRVLLIDDDPLVLRSLTNTLKMDGHEVGAALGGRDGIDTFSRALMRGSRPYDLVMTDLGMPHVDGRQVARAIKTLRPDVPVILLTGWGQNIVEEGQLPEHIDEVLSKPPRLAQVRAALAGHARLANTWAAPAREG